MNIKKNLNITDLKQQYEGGSGRGVGANPLKVNSSPGIIKKYMTQEAGKESPGKQIGPLELDKAEYGWELTAQ